MQLHKTVLTASSKKSHMGRQGELLVSL